MSLRSLFYPLRPLLSPRIISQHLSQSQPTDKFTAAQTKLSSLEPGNDVKLRLYGLYKQAHNGRCNITKPSTFNIVARAKYESWNSLGSLSQDDAKDEYVSLVDEISAVASETGEMSREGVDITVDGGVTMITMNRPHKNNAWTWSMFGTIGDTLNKAAQDHACRVVVITGTGEWYSSGNDLDNFTKMTPEGNIIDSSQSKSSVLNSGYTADKTSDSSEVEVLISTLITSFITFPKPLIAAVNGPAIGIPVTSLGLCDLVYCVKRATFKTPFISLGQSPEACSTYLFPRIMGFSKASEMLLTEQTLTSDEACSAGLVTRIIEEEGFIEEIRKIAQHIASLPPQSMMISKSLIRQDLNSKLLTVNRRELDVLKERVLSEECRTAVMNFLLKKD